MSIRLNKAIRELNIGLQTAVEFLKKRSDLGEVRDDLSFKLSDGQYNALKEEFKSDKEVRNQAEKLLQKHPKEKKRPSDRKEQKPVKATQPQKYTVLGKIDLDSLGKKPVPKAVPEAKPEAPADKASAVSHEPEEVKPVAAQAAAKPVEEAPKPVETVKPVVGTVAAQPDKAAAGKVEDKPAQTEPAVAPEPQKAEPKAEKEDAAPAGSEEDILRRKKARQAAEQERQADDEKNKIVYKIQILTSKEKLPANSRLLKGYKNVECVKGRNFYKYYYGKSTRFNEISRLRKRVIKDFKDAYIVVFKNGKEVKQ